MRGSNLSLYLVLVSLFSVATAGTLIQNEADDPDLPPGMHEPLDEADYINRREAFVALLRGNDPSRPADPMSRSRAIAHMDAQLDALRASTGKLKDINHT